MLKRAVQEEFHQLPRSNKRFTRELCKERLWKAITADAVEKRKQDDLEKATAESAPLLRWMSEIVGNFPSADPHGLGPSRLQLATCHSWQPESRGQGRRAQGGSLEEGDQEAFSSWLGRCKGLVKSFALCFKEMYLTGQCNKEMILDCSKRS